MQPDFSHMRVTPSGVTMAAALALLAGVAVRSFLPGAGGTVLWLLAALGVFIAIAAWPLAASSGSLRLRSGQAAQVVQGKPRSAQFGSRRYAASAAGIVLLFFAFGMLRTGQAVDGVTQQELDALFGQDVELTGEVAKYPDIDLDRVRFVLDAEEPAAGRVLVTAGRHQVPQRGETVRVSGRLRIPEPFTTDTGRVFDYPMFLAKDGISAVMRSEQVSVFAPAPAHHPATWLAKSRSAIDAASLAVLPQREGAVLKAVLIGDEGSMTEPFKEALNASGLRHIVAVSGTNIVIILSIISMSVMRLGGSKKQAFWIGLLFITLFVLLIGAPASAVRAAMMGLALSAAPLLGRRGSGLRAAVAAAAAMVAFSPLTLLYDVGFQLSFLAVLGLVLFMEPVGRLFHRLPPVIAETLTMTFAAQIMVTPLLLATFGRVSLVAPLSNLLVVPAIGPATVLGFLIVLLGSIWVPLGTAAALLLLPYFSLVIWVAETMAAVPVADMVLSGALAVVFTILWWGAALIVWNRLRTRELAPIDRVALA